MGRTPQRKYLLVVRVEFRDHYQAPVRLKEHISWLEENIFPWAPLNQQTRDLVLLTHPVDKVYLHLERPFNWLIFNDAEDLYAKIMSQGFFESYVAKKQFDCAIYINVRDTGIGCGWGLAEGIEERCILRAMILAANGNVLFGDWGYAGNAPPTVTHEDLKRDFKMHSYIYPSVELQMVKKEGPRVHANLPFIRMLDHFLQRTPIRGR